MQNQIHDNRKSYPCHNFPIDAVYTWVNGSDPKLLEQLSKTKKEIQNSISRSDCNEKTCEECVETPIIMMRPIVQNPHQIFDNVTKFENLKDRGSLIYFSSISTGNTKHLIHSFIL